MEKRGVKNYSPGEIPSTLADLRGKKS